MLDHPRAQAMVAVVDIVSSDDWVFGIVDSVYLVRNENVSKQCNFTKPQALPDTKLTRQGRPGHCKVHTPCVCVCGRGLLKAKTNYHNLILIFFLIIKNK